MERAKAVERVGRGGGGCWNTATGGSRRDAAELQQCSTAAACQAASGFTTLYPARTRRMVRLEDSRRTCKRMPQKVTSLRKTHGNEVPLESNWSVSQGF